MSSVGDDEEAPIFTSRTATTTKAAAFEAAAEEAPPTFTPRSLAVPKTAAVAGNDAPVFTPRSSDAAARSQRVLAPPAPAQSDDAPVFTPRSFGAVVETAAGAGEDALIFTPRTTADVDPLANPVSAADDPIFTPRALSAGNAGNLHPAIVTAGAVTDFASLSVEEDEFASSEAAAAAKMAELSGRPSPSRPPANDAPSARAGTATPSPKSTSRSPKASTRSPSESARSTTSTPKGGKKKASPAAGSGKKAAAGTKAKKASAAKKGELSFTVVIQGQSGEISRMATKLGGKYVKAPLGTALILPALQAAKLPTLTLDALTVRVNGELVDEHDLSAAATTFAEAGNPAADIEVVVEVPAGKESIESGYVVDVVSNSGEVLWTAGAELSSTCLAKPLAAAVVEPALKAAKVVNYHKPLAAETTVAVHYRAVDGDQKMTHGVDVAERLARYLPADSAMRKSVRIVIQLPPGVLTSPALPPKRCKFKIDIYEHPDARGEGEGDGPIWSADTTLEGKQLDKQLLSGLVVPALEAYAPEHHRLRKLNASLHKRAGSTTAVDVTKIVLTVDGTPVDGQHAAMRYASSDATWDTTVAITLPPPAPTVAEDALLVDILTADGDEVILSSSTRLKPKWLAKPLSQAIVRPALDAAGLEDLPADAVQIRVDGVPSDGAIQAALLLPGHGGSSKKLMLGGHPPVQHQIDIILNASASTLALAGSPSATLTSASFEVVIKTASGEQLADFETTLNKKWLGKTIHEALVLPALRAANAEERAQDISISADGKEDVPATTKASRFARGDGSATLVVITVSDDAPVMRVRRTKSSFGSLAPAIAPALQPPVFLVSVEGGGVEFQTQTQLTSVWLSKPIRQGLAASALQAYYKLDQGAQKVKVEDMLMSINGEQDEGLDAASSYVKRVGTPVPVVLTFPGVQQMRLSVSKV